jgi:hypothetical protein
MGVNKEVLEALGAVHDGESYRIGLFRFGEDFAEELSEVFELARDDLTPAISCMSTARALAAGVTELTANRIMRALFERYPRAVFGAQCTAIPDGRLALVQGDRQIPKGQPGHEAGHIAWWEHEAAYRDYSKRYGTAQSIERLNDRGGFGYAELVDHLNRDPFTWRGR